MCTCEFILDKSDTVDFSSFEYMRADHVCLLLYTIQSTWTQSPGEVILGL